jgi:uncharacterized protein YcfJ
MKKSLIFISVIILISGCASVEKSSVLGAVIGGTAGGLIGNSARSGRSESTMVGVAVGAGLGTLIGASAYKDKIKKEQEQALQKNPMDSKTPFLTAPKVRRVWVPARIEGDKYIDGHYMYVIEKTSTWSD